MRFWDSSAIIPILILEPNTSRTSALLHEDRECWIWWASRTECLSGLHRRARAGGLSVEELDVARQRLALFERASATVLPSEPVRARADRLLGLHALRAADAFQLAAALVASEENPEGLPFVTLDERLIDAARREGFRVLPA
jgi:predicted nucleic acid-binding protein